MKGSIIAYLIAEVAKTTVFDGEEIELLNFTTIRSNGETTVPLYISRLDAELCRQRLSRHNNNYMLVKITDRRVAPSLRLTKDWSSLVIGFFRDGEGRLVLGGANYSLLHMRMNADDMNWLFAGRLKPENDALTYIQKLFIAGGEKGYLKELENLDRMNTNEISNLARNVLLGCGVAPNDTSSTPQFYSPFRNEWVKFIKTKSTRRYEDIQ